MEIFRVACARDDFLERFGVWCFFIYILLVFEFFLKIRILNLKPQKCCYSCS